MNETLQDSQLVALDSVFIIVSCSVVELPKSIMGFVAGAKDLSNVIAKLTSTSIFSRDSTPIYTEKGRIFF